MTDQEMADAVWDLLANLGYVDTRGSKEYRRRILEEESDVGWYAASGRGFVYRVLNHPTAAPVPTEWAALAAQVLRSGSPPAAVRLAELVLGRKENQ